MKKENKKIERLKKCFNILAKKYKIDISDALEYFELIEDCQEEMK